LPCAQGFKEEGGAFTTAADVTVRHEFIAVGQHELCDAVSTGLDVCCLPVNEVQAFPVAAGECLQQRRHIQHQVLQAVQRAADAAAEEVGQRLGRKGFHTAAQGVT